MKYSLDLKFHTKFLISETNVAMRSMMIYWQPCSAELRGSGRHPAWWFAADVVRVTGRCHRTHAGSQAVSTVETTAVFIEWLSLTRLKDWGSDHQILQSQHW